MEKIESQEFITSETQEITYGRERWLSYFFKAFPAFDSRNYQLYFSGQLISLTGTWLQTVAQGWLIFELTKSAFWVGVVSALGSLPILVFSIFGGVIVDRYNKKDLILITQSVFMILALVLGILTITHTINVLYICVIAFLIGIFAAVDFPARQAFVIEMVGREKLASAIALNSTQFNGARVIGPAVAGALIAIFGIGGAFILNGISFIAVIIALLFIRVKEVTIKTDSHPIESIKEGLSYTYTHPIIKTLLIFTAISSIFGWSYATLMPVIVQNVFHQGVSSLGLFYSAAGLGALAGAAVVSIFSRRKNPLFLIIGGNTLFTLSLFLFSFTVNINVALFLLFLAGMGLLMQFSTISTTIQHLVRDNLRGRVMSLYTLSFIGMTPIGSFQIGYIAEHFGVNFAIKIGAAIVFVFGIYLFFNRNKIIEEYRQYTALQA